MNPALISEPSSYRDPSGFIFNKNGVLYRQVNRSFAEHFDHFISSGCYDHLVKNKLLIPHETIEENFSEDNKWHCTLKPEVVPFISYPYEWTFGMLREAALLTITLAKEAMRFGMMLKDASAYNIQWHKGRMIFIDTLSFEKYDEQKPWIAYRQFCEHFLGPLLLMHYRKLPLTEMLLAWPDGIPLSVNSALLPRRSRFSLPVYLHIHLHAKYSTKTAGKEKRSFQFSKKKMEHLLNSLEQLVQRLKIPEKESAWSAYYDEASQRKDYLENKKAIITEWLPQFFDVKTAVDLGANDGEFSKLVSAKDIFTIATDADPYCIDRLYRSIRNNQTNLQPLVNDLSHPSPAIGVNNKERTAFTDRAKAGLVMALALIHHLAIGKNIPLEKIAAFFSDLSRKWLIVEFVPRTDEKIIQMLQDKKDIYDQYTQENFENIFRGHFDIRDKKLIADSGRTIYLMKKHGE